MKKISIQFHALSYECIQWSELWAKEYDLNFCVIQYFPDFLIKKMSSSAELSALEDNSYRVIAFSRGAIDVSVKSPSDFDKKNPQALSLHLGKESGGIVEESWLVTSIFFDDTGVNKVWQKIARNLKSITKSGAWAENVNTGGRSYYRNHRFTDGARQAQKDGVQFVPTSGKYVRYDFLTPAN